VGVPTLDALAWRLPYCAYPICPILDARKNEVYTGRYRTVAGRLELLEAARAMPPSALAEELRDGSAGPVVFMGDAVGRFGPIFSEILGTRAWLAPADLRLPSAVTVGELAAAALERGEAADPGSLVPLYVRPSEAELARERRQGAGRQN
jgi:tRNA threonylcarbamoyladenosine biosynthesis protein TsaB